MRYLSRHPGASSLAFFLASFGAFSEAIVNRRSSSIEEKSVVISAGFVMLGTSASYFKQWLFSGNRYALIPVNPIALPVPVVSAVIPNP